MRNRLRTYFSCFRVRDGIVLVMLSLVVAVLGVVSTSYIKGEGYYSFSGTDTFIYVGLWALVFAAATLVIDIAYEFALPHRRTAVTHKPKQHRVRRVLTHITPHWSKKSILLFALIMFVFWLPFAIIDYPDSLYYDTFYQVRQAYPEYHPTSIIPFDWRATQATLTDSYFTDHHPIFDTLFYAAFGMASDALTGDWSVGVFTFILLQSATTALFFTIAVAYLRQWKCPIILSFMIYIFLCLMPFYACWATAMVKDSLFCAIYLPYFILLAELVRTRGENMQRTRTIVLFIIVGILLCLTRKTGIYIVVPTAVIAAAIYRKYWLPLAGQAVSCLVVMLLVLPYAVFPLLNVAPGGKQEALSLLFQQTAKFYKDHYDDVTTPEWAAIGKLMPTSKIDEAYTYHAHDPIKFMIDPEASAEDYAAYARVWIVQGLRHPESYLSALMSVGGAFFGFDGHTAVRILDTDFYLNPEEYLAAIGRSETAGTAADPEAAGVLASAEASAGADAETDAQGSPNEDDSATENSVNGLVRAGKVDETASAGSDSALASEATESDASEQKRYATVQPEFLEPTRHALKEAYDTVSMLPGIIVLFTDATYLVWLPCIALFVAWRRRLPMKLLFVPFAIVLFFCLIGPAASTRYALPSIYTTPLLMGTVAVFIRAQWRSGRHAPGESDEHDEQEQERSGRVLVVKRARSTSSPCQPSTKDPQAPQ